MALRSTTVLVVLLVAGSVAHAQYAPRFYETPEPPLADAVDAVRQGPGRDTLTLTSATRVVDVGTPVVQLSVRAPATQAAGSPLPIKLIVENAARSPAHNVTIVYALPAGTSVTQATPQESARTADSVTWKFDVLAAASRKEISFTVQPTASATEMTHKARIAYEFEPATQTTRFAKPELKLRKFGPDQALKHDILVMALEVTNTGGTDLVDVQMVDPLPDGFEHRPDDPTAANQASAAKPASEISADKKSRTFKIGRLAPGQSRRVEYYVMATGAVGPIVHQATALAAGMSEPVRVESKVTIAEPKLELSADAPPRQPANQPCRVLIKLTNRSLRALANIVVSDRLAGEGQIESASSGGQTFDGRVQWIVPLLAANESRAFEAIVRCPRGGRIVHQVSAVYRGLSQGTETATEFEAIAALQWEFRGSTHAVELNGEVQYTLLARNAGSAPAVNVRPAIALPAEMKLVKSSPNAKDDGGRMAFDAVTVPPGGRLTYTVTAKAMQTAVEARVVGELAADDFTAGPVRKQEVITIGANGSSMPITPPGPQPRLPQPAPPPPRR